MVAGEGRSSPVVGLTSELATAAGRRPSVPATGSFVGFDVARFMAAGNLSWLLGTSRESFRPGPLLGGVERDRPAHRNARGRSHPHQPRSRWGRSGNGP